MKILTQLLSLVCGEDRHQSIHVQWYTGALLHETKKCRVLTEYVAWGMGSSLRKWCWSWDLKDAYLRSGLGEESILGTERAPQLCVQRCRDSRKGKASGHRAQNEGVSKDWVHPILPLFLKTPFYSGSGQSPLGLSESRPSPYTQKMGHNLLANSSPHPLWLIRAGHIKYKERKLEGSWEKSGIHTKPQSSKRAVPSPPVSSGLPVIMWHCVHLESVTVLTTQSCHAEDGRMETVSLCPWRCWATDQILDLLPQHS